MLEARRIADELNVDVRERYAKHVKTLVQVGEGALNEVSNILVRLRELSIQAANGSSSPADRNTIKEEFDSTGDAVESVADGLAATALDHADQFA